MAQKIKLVPNKNFPLTSKFEWMLVINEKSEPINNFSIEGLCYSMNEFVEGFGTSPMVVVEAKEVEIITDMGQKIASIK